MILLETKNIVKKYANQVALNDVSIRIAEGSIYGILGPNGAGKTSLLRIINQINYPDSGQVYINGQPCKPSDVYQIGYLPEERGLYPKMKVYDHILYLAQLRKIDKREAKNRIDNWLDQLEISSQKNKTIQELSKGMQQKVQFIASIIHDPKLLILDEPFSGFDPINVVMLKRIIQDLQKSGKTIILSTHNMSSVEELCDEIALLNKSKVLLQGNVWEIRNKFKKNILSISIKNSDYSLDIDGVKIISVTKLSDNVRIRLEKFSNMSNSELLRSISLKYEILSFDEELPSMNEIFIQTLS